MNRVLKQAGILTGLVIITGILRIPFLNYDDTVRGFILDQSSLAGVYTTLGNLHFSFPPNLSVEKVDAIVPTPAIPVPIQVERINARVSLLSLLLLRVGVLTELYCYKGGVVVNLNASLLNGKRSVAVHADKLQLGEHPILKTYAISGSIDADIKTDLKQDGAGYIPTKGEATITVAQGEYQGGHMVQGIVKLPPVRSIEGNATLTLDSGIFNLERFSLGSSIGTIRGGGKFSLIPSMRAFEQATLNFSIALSEEGRLAVGPYLALASQTSVEAPSNSWQIEIIKKAGPGQPKVTIKPS